VQGKQAKGINPYPHKFDVSLSLPDFIEQYKGLEDGAQLSDVTVAVAGGRRRGGAPAGGPAAQGASGGAAAGRAACSWPRRMQRPRGMHAPAADRPPSAGRAPAAEDASTPGPEP
jgi:hypothetical protein